ncbi:hypothetical protein D3C78_900570 [compost metagenome]
MHNKTWLIWRHSLQFLKAFQSLRYDHVPIGMLLLRDFQKYALRHTVSLRSAQAVKALPVRDLQAACKPYMLQAKPDLGKSGYTLIRAELFGVAKDSVEEKLLYVAHYPREYKFMKKQKACRPLINFQSLPPAKLSPALAGEVMRRLRQCLASPSTPAVFRRRSFRIWMTARVRHAILQVRRAHTLFERYPIKRTIYGSTMNHHGVLITSFAQSRNVHTVNVQHGLFGPLGHLPVNADMNFVWGKSHYDFLRSYGAPAEKIMVSGPCFYRNLPSRDSADARPPGVRLQALVALQPLGHSFNTRMIRLIEQAAKPFDRSVSVQYKLHPDQGGGSLYTKLLRCRRSRIIKHGTVPLNKLIMQADVVLTPFSSVAYESLMSGKPVFFYKKPRFVYYIRSAPTCFRSAGELTRLLSRAIKEPWNLGEWHRRMGVKDKAAASGGDGARFIWAALRRLSAGKVSDSAS